MSSVEQKTELKALLESRSRLTPFRHQIEAVQFFFDLPYAGNFSEMGTGKSKITIDLAQCLYHYGKITKVIVITDASIRPVWFDPEFGELAKHLWKEVRSKVVEYHQNIRVWNWEETIASRESLEWIITNYDYIIDEGRLKELIGYVNNRTLLVLDESSAVKNKESKRAKACKKLRAHCGRVMLLNGTPIPNSPFDMLSQGNIMSPSILECSGIGQMRARYAEMGGHVVETPWGHMATQVLRYKNLEDLQNRFKPYVLRFEKKDCLDLPGKLPPVTLTSTMTPTEWKIYKGMRDEMVAWLGTSVASATQVITKILRLSQITSGFIGGVEALDEILEDGAELPPWLQQLQMPMPFVDPLSEFGSVREIGTSKLDTVLEWFAHRFEENPTIKIIAWCRFVPELHRLVKVLREKYVGKVQVESMHGGQKPEERQRALRLLDPRTTCAGPGIVVATIGTGGKGHTFTASHTVINISFDYSLEKHLQAMDRVDRIGQTIPVSYTDVVAVGPAGQKTVDHQILKARLGKEELATWTTRAWVKALLEE